MMAKEYEDVREILSYYGSGWEVECIGKDKKDSMRLLKEYNENVPQWPHKLRHRRVAPGKED